MVEWSLKMPKLNKSHRAIKIPQVWLSPRDNMVLSLKWSAPIKNVVSLSFPSTLKTTDTSNNRN